MITSVIGKMFLEAYNCRYNACYDARGFFMEKFYPLFFNHSKYMMSGGNSPLENPKIVWNKVVLEQCPPESIERRQERLESLIKKIESGEPDASYAMGYPSQNVLTTTSGQITNILLPDSVNEIYLSWIGAALGVGVEGGYSIFFYSKEILMDVFEGWEVYRSLLTENKLLKGNQITTWNGIWLTHRYSGLYCKDNPLINLGADIFVQCIDKKWVGCLEISTQSWTKVLIGICKSYPISKLMGYIYSYGQTNTTIGFIPFDLSQIDRPVKLYRKIFGMDSGSRAEKLWGTAVGLKKSCQSGSIGIKAMEPKGFRGCIEKGEIPKLVDDEDKKLSFNVYRIWIMAMLNNQDLWDKAESFANSLYSYSLGDSRAKTEKANRVKSILESNSKIGFMKSLSAIISDADNVETFKEIAYEINLMQPDNVPYFLTLIRFQYAVVSRNKN